MRQPYKLRLSKMGEFIKKLCQTTIHLSGIQSNETNIDELVNLNLNMHRWHVIKDSRLIWDRSQPNYFPTRTTYYHYWHIRAVLSRRGLREVRIIMLIKANTILSNNLWLPIVQIWVGGHFVLTAWSEEQACFDLTLPLLQLAPNRMNLLLVSTLR